MKTGSKVTVARTQWDWSVSALKNLASTLKTVDGSEKWIGRQISEAVQMLEYGEARIYED